MLNGVSLDVRRGEILLLYGENGCGKTTLLSLIKPETAPKGASSGSLARGFAEGGAGLVMQEPEMQIVTDRVWHELAFACESLGWERERIRRRVGETAAYFGLQPIFRRDTASLSGGQKQLLNLAAATVTAPELLLLDEPTAQLDPLSAESFMNTVRRLNRELGITFVICEHNTENAFPLADRAAYMEKGRVIDVLPPRELGRLLAGKPMFGGLPCAQRIGAALGAEELPLTSGEARELVGRFGGPLRPDEPTQEPLGECVLKAKGLCLRYEPKGEDILRGVSLELHRDEIFSVLGANGSGKSTLLRVLAGLLPPTGGKALYMGRALKSYGAELYRGGIALLPQDPRDCFAGDSLREDWTLMAEASGFGSWDGLAERLGLADVMDTHPYDLSGGERQKAALGKILMRRPRVLLLDEPAKGLDAPSRAAFVEILRSLAREGAAILLVTHDAELAASVSRRCALLFDGELLAAAPPEEFFGENIFFTTPAARISRVIFKNAVTAEKIAELCRLNGEKNER